MKTRRKNKILKDKKWPISFKDFSFPKTLLIITLGFLICFQAQTQKSPIILSKKRFIKILSIDGEGIRGIIPALVLKALETKLKYKSHLAECFDVMAGTS